MSRFLTIRKASYDFGPAIVVKRATDLQKSAQPAAAKVAASKPITVPGCSPDDALPRIVTPKQGAEGRRSAFLRQESETDPVNNVCGAIAPAKPMSPPMAGKIDDASAATLGSWATRQKVLPLPSKPAAAPMHHTKARPRPQPSDADTIWRHRFRQKWRREQLRARWDGPDFSPSPRDPLSDMDDEDEDLIFGELEGLPLPPAAPQAHAAPAARQSRTNSSGVMSRAAAPTAAPLPVAVKPLPPLKVMAPAPPPAAEVLDAAFPGAAPIRKVVMRGKATNSGKLTTPERKWQPPKLKSPARASQAA